jgi:hypothetical protein
MAALKGPNMIAQGKALGTRWIEPGSSERARYERLRRPFRAFVRYCISTQGYALGYHIFPFQGNRCLYLKTVT